MEILAMLSSNIEFLGLLIGSRLVLVLHIFQ